MSLLLALVSFTVSIAQNPIVTENALAGNPISEWGLTDAPDVFKDTRINGFATQMSVNSGETVRFKIDVPGGVAVTYTIKIYRIGYYGGMGARLVADLTPGAPLIGTAQPAPINQQFTTGLVDCGNWSESATWNVPASAVSGLYIANLQSSDGGKNHIVFIVRNDNYASDLFLQFPDATWQAYNFKGANNFYDGTTTDFPNGHAVKVSYNRPFFIETAGFAGTDDIEDWYMNNEYPMIRWLERNGYNITYATSIDIASRPAQLLIHKVFISLGHDEYWSKEQRDNVTAARDAGVNLAFFSGNEVYWKTRWENSIDGTNTPYRTLVCYKEGELAPGVVGEAVCGFGCDPSNEWTGLWRVGSDAYGGGDNGSGNPENALTGQISWDKVPGAIQVPDFYKKLRFWRNTSIANLGAGQTATLAPHTLGYEWDWEQFPDSYPRGRMTMSSTTLANHTHKLSLYRHTSGALVFGAGTVQWSWGLDNEHFNNASSAVSQDMQQATVNLFADMDVQPANMQPNLTPAIKSTDITAPVSAILSPVSGTSVSPGSTVLITGNATDGGGGVVTGVEVSTDGGATWHTADISAIDGNVTWSYSWLTVASGTFNVKSKGFDDSGNGETPGAGITITVGAVCPCTIFQPTDVPAVPLQNAGQPIELGVKFLTTLDGYITGIRFYKGAGGAGTHTGHLWSSTGTQLAEATFINETASGWQEVLFTTPVAVTAGTTYVASYFSSSGDFASTNPFFTQAVENGPLKALANGEDGPNGVFIISATPAFPTNNFETTNYFVDVVFNTSISSDVTPPTVFSVSPLDAATGVSVYTSVTANFDEVINAATVTSSTFELRDAGNALIPAAISAANNQITLIPSLALNYSSSYTATIKGGTSGVKDPAGNPLAADYIWTFTTGADNGSTFTIFQPADVPANPQNSGPAVELGVKFRTRQNGYITAIRFYKGAGATGTHIGHLWSSTGTQLAEATFTNESASGWQEVLLTTPVAITAGTTYVASYFSSSGEFAFTYPFFTQAVVNGPLRALASGEDGPNGIFIFTATPAFPTNNFETTNYWADVVFAPGDYTPPTVLSVTPLNGATGVSVSTVVSAIFSEDLNATTVSGSTVELRNGATLVPAAVSYNAGTKTATLTPSAVLAGSTVYTATIKGGASGVKDLANNALASDYSWSFTTEADVIPPTVLSVLPVNNATGVNISTAISAIFSEDINASTVSGSTVELRNGATLVPAVVSYNAGTKTATLTPSAVLDYSTVYTATIKGGESGVKDISGNALTSDYSWSFTTAVAPGTYNIFSSVSGVSDRSGQPREVGVKFRVTQPGHITGIRFYKGTNNTGTHIGHLWSSTGTKLAEATFTNETASGWQEVLFTNPVAITTGTTYVASYFSSAGYFAFTSPYFSSAVVNGPLRALAYGEDGPNGVYKYSSSSVFPNNTGGGSSNYWVDVVFTPDVIPPTVSSVTPVNSAIDVSIATAISAIFSEDLDASTVSGSTIELRNASNALIAATVSYNAGTKTATVTPSAPLATSTEYTATIKGGASGVKDLAGNTLTSDYIWSFTTSNTAYITHNIFLPTSVVGATQGGQPREVGVKFRVTQPGHITGIRFYKGITNVGTHIGHLWSRTGTQLAEATFTNETASGWQEVLFTTPVAVTTGTTYVASYFSSAGYFAFTNPYFTSAVVNGPLRALANGEDGPNGVYKFSSSSVFPNNTGGGSSNYWVDVVFTTEDVIPPTISSVTPVNAATGVSVSTAVSAIFSEDLNASTVSGSTVELRNGGTLVPAVVSYNAGTKTATLTPSVALAFSTVYTATIKGGASGVKDAANNALASDYIWSFTTSNTVTHNIFLPTSVVGATQGGQPREVGVKFRVTQPGYITGIRFYKGATNVGTHIGHLWSSTGTKLGEATFINETASGWQEVLFTTPVAVTTGTTYVASYFSSAGYFAFTNPYFTSAVVNGPLRALANGEDGPNGVYKFSTTSVFPNNTGGGSSNYWVDVVFTTSDVIPPTVSSVTPVNGATGVSVSTSVWGIFSEDLNASTVSGSTVELRNGGTLIPAVVSYNAGAKTATLTPSAALAFSTVYTATIKGGASGVKDAANNALASDFIWSFTTETASSQPNVSILNFDTKTSSTSATIHSLTGVPAGALLVLTTTNNTGNPPYDCSVSSSPSLTWTKRADAGAINSNNAEIWTAVYSAGGSVSVTSNWGSESQASVCYVVLNAEPALGGASGTAVSQSAPSVTINTTRANSIIFGCTADWNAINGATRTLRDAATERLYFRDIHYTAYFYTKAAATVAAYTEGVSAPTGQQASTALLEIRSSSTATGDVTPPTVLSVSPVNSATGVSTITTVSAIFSEDINPSTVTGSTFELRNGGTLVPAAVSYNAGTKTATLTPSAALANSTVYTATIKGGTSGVKDLANNALASDHVWSFTTGTSSPVTYTIFPSTSLGGGNQSAQPREVGVKFRVTQPGSITGVRFHKATANTGTHVGHLWSSTGTMLAEATFINESASGWQQVLFSNPVAITTGTTYIASYYTPTGNHDITHNYFTSAVVNGPLRALATGEDGNNGVFLNSPVPIFPTTGSLISSNFWVDVVFTTSSGKMMNQSLFLQPMDKKTSAQKLIVKVIPNPSADFFKLIAMSDDKAPISIRISDISGRVLEHYEKVASGSLLQVGRSLKGGTYFAEVIQGDQRKVVKIIKINN